MRRYLSSESAASVSPYAIPFLAIAPSLIWIALDDAAWGGDASQYGHAALELFNALTHSLTAWASYLFEALRSKPNGLIWIGQFFVPLAYVTRSVDTALLLSVMLIQALSLMLMYRSIRALSGSAVLVPLIGCLAMASAPDFIQTGHVYLVESLQTLSVTWFILIMTLAPTWSRALILSQLLAASVLAMLAKEIQPIFCLWPGILALGHVLRRRTSPSVSSSSAGADSSRGRSTARRRQRRRDRLAARVERRAPPGRFATGLTLALGLPLAVITLVWYVHNFGPVKQHVIGGAFAPEVGTVWGKYDTYLNTIWFWARTARDSFSLPWIWAGWVLIVASGTLRYALTPRRLPSHFTLCSAAAASQIITVFLAFAVSPTRQTRFLLPVLPYFALVVAWSVEQLRHRLIARLAAVALATQFALLHGQALHLIPPLVPSVIAFERSSYSTRILEAVVTRTCRGSSSPYLNVLAVDPSVRGDWFAPEPANYVVAKNRFWSKAAFPPCFYDYVGGAFFGSTVQRAWNSLVTGRARYFITVDPSVYPPPRRPYNQVLSEQNFPVMLDMVRTSGLFVSEPPLREDPGFLIFRRISF